VKIELVVGKWAKNHYIRLEETPIVTGAAFTTVAVAVLIRGVPPNDSESSESKSSKSSDTSVSVEGFPRL
jgi:hypothetical protein